jgi:hypothetical protein
MHQVVPPECSMRRMAHRRTGTMPVCDEGGVSGVNLSIQSHVHSVLLKVSALSKLRIENKEEDGM